MIQYPIRFQAHANAQPGISQPWSFASQGLQGVCTVPPEFEGPGGGYSPEDLFAQALTNCFIATFKVFAEKSRLKFDSLAVVASLTVDLDENGKPVMRHCEIAATITGASDVERIKLIANKAFKSGFILNSVKTETSFRLQVS